jgi:hypothetical protein
VVLIAVSAYAAIAIVTISPGVEAKDVWYPVSLVVVILFLLIGYIAKQQCHG